MKRSLNGSVTVLLSMVFLILLAFVGGVIESASIQTGKSEKRAAVGLAAASVFGEFHKELLERYDIFAIDSGYGNGPGEEGNLLTRLDYYGPPGTRHKVKKIQYLTDLKGEIFRRQAVKSMLAGTEIGESEEAAVNQAIEEQNRADQYEKNQKDTEKEMDQALTEAGESMPEDNNPITHIKQLGQGSLLKLICRNQEQISKNTIDLSSLPSHRSLQKGRGDFVIQKPNIAEKLLLNEYFLKHFEEASKEPQKKEEHALVYELEYLIAGKGSDEENLEKTAKKLLLMRMTSNYTYLLTDSAKQAEADTAAAVLSGAMLSPELQPLIKQGLLLAWAYGEGIMDLRNLLSGGKVPLVKNSESWQSSLLGLLKLGMEGDGGEVDKGQQGMSYKEYLRMLFLLEQKETLSMRALDLIEANMKLTDSGDGFMADCCVTAVQIESEAALRRGTVYRFQSSYGYQ